MYSIPPTTKLGTVWQARWDELMAQSGTVPPSTSSLHSSFSRPTNWVRTIYPGGLAVSALEQGCLFALPLLLPPRPGVACDDPAGVVGRSERPTPWAGRSAVLERRKEYFCLGPGESCHNVPRPTPWFPVHCHGSHPPPPPCRILGPCSHRFNQIFGVRENGRSVREYHCESGITPC